MKQIPLLTTEDIEVKIKQCTKAGAVASLYKTARVDYRILDQVFGTFGWQVDYTEIKGNLYCTISLWDNETKQWVKKTNCGIESREDGEGNEKKGEASDAAKRAGFVVGIGAELYSAPFIFLEVATEQDTKTGKYRLSDPYARYVVTDIKYNEETRVITALTIANEKTGVTVFTWTMPTTGAKAKKMNKTVSAEKTAVEAPKKATVVNTQDSKESSSNEPKMALKDIINKIGTIAKKISTANGNLDAYYNIVEKAAGDRTFKCNKATEAQYAVVFQIYKDLVSAGYDK